MREITKKIYIADLGALDQLSRAVAPQIQGFETFELCSDLGGGKTTFVRSLIATLGSQDMVSSPSFTIENVYRCPQFDVHHFDFYRLEQAGICAQQLEEALANPRALVIVEWAQIVHNLLPKQHLTIDISLLPRNSQARWFVLKTPPALTYLLHNL